MTAGKKIYRLIIIVVIGLTSIIGQAQTKDSVLTISPNPFVSHTDLTIKGLSNNTVSLNIFSITGSLVETLLNSIVISDSLTITFHADSLPNGVYFIKLTLNSTDHNFKIIKNSNLNSDFQDFKNLLEIYPKPTTDLIFIKSNLIVTDIQIFDCNGKKVREQNNYNNSIDLNDLEKGIYLLHLRTNNGLFIDKVIKQ